MKILIVIPSLSSKWGGTTSSIANFYKGLNDNDIKCTIVSTITEDEKNDISTNIVENSDVIFFKTKNNWRYSSEFNRYLKSEINKFDLVWIHTLWTSVSYLAAKYSNKNKIPYIVTPHGMIEPDALKRKSLKKKVYWHLIEKKVFNRAAAIHCITEEEERYSKSLSSSNTFVVPNGVEETKFLFKNYNDLKKICFIGRFHEKKGLDLLLKSLTTLSDLDLIVAGGGDADYETYISQLVEDLNIKKRVKFVGFADEVIKKKLYEESLFLVLPSYTEGLSMVGLESIMHSTPVLTTVKCNFNIITGFDAGLVMDDNNPDTIANGIKNMLSQNIEKMSRNAHQLAVTKFSINSVATNIINEFKNYCNYGESRS